MKEKWDPSVERCGIITADGEILEMENQSKTPAQTFEFRFEDLEGAAATWHSHPTGSANLSIDDFWFFKSWSSIFHLIVAYDEVRCYLDFEQRIYLVDDEEDYPARASEG